MSDKKKKKEPEDPPKVDPAAELLGGFELEEPKVEAKALEEAPVIDIRALKDKLRGGIKAAKEEAPVIDTRAIKEKLRSDIVAAKDEARTRADKRKEKGAQKLAALQGLEAPDDDQAEELPEDEAPAFVSLGPPRSPAGLVIERSDSPVGGVPLPSTGEGLPGFIPSSGTPRRKDRKR